MKKEKQSWLNTPFSKLKEKFLEDLQDKKKIQALLHLSQARNYRQQNLVKLVAQDYKTGFLEPQEQVFLDYVLEKHQIDYLNWCHKTRGTKREMAEMKAKFEKKLVKRQAKKQIATPVQSKIVQLPLFPDLEKKNFPEIPAVAIKRSVFRKFLRA